MAPRRSRLWLLSATFCLLVTAPLVGQLAGIRPELPDNRAATEVPDAASLVGLDTAAWEQLQQAFRDRLPGLDWAVRQNARLALRLTGRSPNDNVVLGTGEWLFLAETIERPCLDDAGLDRLDGQLARLRAAAAAAGVRLLVVVAPDKAAIEVQRLQPADRDRSCAAADLDRIAERLAGDDVLVPVELLRREAAAGRDPYYPRDTHWTSDTAALVVEQVVATLGLGEQHVVRQRLGERGTIGDLSVLQGLAPAGTYPCFTAVRPGVMTTGQRPDCLWSPSRPNRIEASSSGPALLPPMVLQFDSFGLPMLDLMGSWFERITAFYKQGGTEDDVLAALRSSDLLVFELVQRTIGSDDVSAAVDRLVAALQAMASGTTS